MQLRWVQNVVVSVAVWLAVPTVVAQQLIFDGAAERENHQAQFVQAMLTEAYSELGITLNFQSAPIGRSFVEANAGRIDGLRARVEQSGQQFPNLLKVDVPLLEIDVMIVADRRDCGLCELSSLNSLATVQGMLAADKFLLQQSKKFQRVDVANTDQAMAMLDADRIDGVLVTEAMLENVSLLRNPHYIVYPVATISAYHWLNKKHADLLPKIQRQLETMDSVGRIAELAGQFGIDRQKQPLADSITQQVSAVSSAWLEYSDSESATYWRLMRHAFGKLKIEITNWKRAKKQFFAYQFDVLVGAYASEVKPGTILSASHIDYEEPVLAIGKNTALLKSQIAGDISARACQMLGYDFQPWLPATIEMYEVTDLDDCYRMLSSDRVDMIIDYRYGMDDRQDTPLQAIEVRERLPIFLIFHDDPRGRYLRRQFDNSFRNLVISGQAVSFYPSVDAFNTAQLLGKD
ncbi:hypothetical protein ACFQMB_14765 [Pseudobowmanella zhangzhouensis]|uniref:hypothetical protein n=1 Tax=Pseudobowmanella zhangzhouensis TaxID=1537679 RepID=UPI00360E51BF